MYSWVDDMKRKAEALDVAENSHKKAALSPKKETKEAKKIIIRNPWAPRLQCPDCLTSQIVEDHHEGFTICQQCGRVVGERLIATESEWRTFADGDSSKEDPNRVGGFENPLFNDFGLSTRVTEDGSAISRLQAREGMEA